MKTLIRRRIIGLHSFPVPRKSRGTPGLYELRGLQNRFDRVTSPERVFSPVKVMWCDFDSISMRYFYLFVYLLNYYLSFFLFQYLEMRFGKTARFVLTTAYLINMVRKSLLEYLVCGTTANLLSSNIYKIWAASSKNVPWCARTVTAQNRLGGCDWADAPVCSGPSLSDADSLDTIECINGDQRLG